MSEPIMDLVMAYARAAFNDHRIGVGKAEYDAIEREIAALRERAEQWERNFAIESESRAKCVQRIADLEAERAALMEAAKVSCEGVTSSFATGSLKLAIEVCEGKPGALAAWMSREGR